MLQPWRVETSRGASPSCQPTWELVRSGDATTIVVTDLALAYTIRDLLNNQQFRQQADTVGHAHPLSDDDLPVNRGSSP